MERIYPQPVTPGTTNVFSVVELITPQRALQMLNSSPGNRKTTRIEKYANEMLAGNWALVPDHIALDENGRLINGHNRLGAVIKSGVNVLMQVDYGINRDDMAKIDVGKSRTGGDILAFLFRNLENVNTVSGATRILVSYFRAGEKAFNQRDYKFVTFDDISKFVMANQEEISNISVTTPFPGSPSVAFAACFVLNRINKDDAKTFFQQVKEEYSPYTGYPTKTLQKYLVSTKYFSDGGRIEAFAKTLKAWNFWRKGKTCARLHWQAGDDFPIPE